MNKLELLSPAGGRESLIAAVQNGANATYFGMKEFSARASAANFDMEGAKWAIEYCLMRGVLPYITMNTLLLDKELDQAVEQAYELYKMGAGALIVQDMGLIKRLKSQIPALALHGSTQMTVHNAKGVECAKQLGLKRVVIAREASLKDIESFNSISGIELEIFGHGAMCASVSGQCLFSSVVGDRSGNRGKCAQPCRMHFELEGEESFALSMKDMCTIDFIDEIAKSGARCIKLEGRMKSPEYVAIITKAYRAAIDGANSKEIQNLKSDMLRAFNRGGFSQGYYFSRDNLVDDKRQGHAGFEIGEINHDGIQLYCAINKGDELAARPAGALEDFAITIRKDYDEGFANIKMPGVQGDKIYRTYDTELMTKAAMSYAKDKIKTRLNMRFEAKLGQAVSLELWALGKTAKVYGEIVQKSQKAPMTEESVVRSLNKMADCAFEMGNIECSIDDCGVFLPVSEINLLRRNGIEAITNAAMQAKDQALAPYCNCEKSDEKEKIQTREIIAQFPDIVKAHIAVKFADAIYAEPRDCSIEELSKWNLFAKENSKRIYLVAPSFMLENEFELFFERIDSLEQLHFAGALAGNIGMIAPLKKRFKDVRGDYKLNITNLPSLLSHLELGLSQAALSAELSAAQIRDIALRAPCEAIVYGRLPLMNLMHCPIRRKNRGCIDNCLVDGIELTDRKGYKFEILPLCIRRGMCTVQIFNNAPIDAMRFYKEIDKSNIATWRLIFTNEDETIIKDRIEAFKSGDGEALEGSTGGGLKNKANW